MSLIIAMSAFALSMSISPGPVNLITLSSGMRFGFRRTMGFVCGASMGFTLLLLAIGLGLGEIAELLPFLLQLLGGMGCLYIAYMGISLYTSAQALENLSLSDQPGFWQGAALQWLNPKAWMACLAGVSGFGLSHSLPLLILFVTLYAVICFVSIACWAAVGQRIKHLLQDSFWRIAINRLMGASLVGIAIYLLYSQLVK